MSRGVDASMLSALQAQQVQVAHLVDVELDSGTIYVTDAWRPITYASNTYSALGHFLGIDAIDETTQLRVNDATLSLSGVDQSWVSSVLSEQVVNRRIKVRWVVLDASWAVVGTPLLVLDGRMDDPVIEEDPDSGQSTVAVRAVNIWSDFERTNGRRTNAGSQSRDFPADKGFQYVHQAGRAVVWGRR